MRYVYKIPRQLYKLKKDVEKPPYWRELYRVWHNMMQRCYNSTCVDYKNYGERGITVDERWHQFAQFYEDVVHLYVKGQTIQRIDNDKRYGLENIKWAKSSEQNENRRKPKHYKKKRRQESQEKRKHRATRPTIDRIIDIILKG